MCLFMCMASTSAEGPVVEVSVFVEMWDAAYLADVSALPYSFCVQKLCNSPTFL